MSPTCTCFDRQPRSNRERWTAAGTQTPRSKLEAEWSTGRSGSPCSGWVRHWTPKPLWSRPKRTRWQLRPSQWPPLMTKLQFRAKNKRCRGINTYKCCEINDEKYEFYEVPATTKHFAAFLGILSMNTSPSTQWLLNKGCTAASATTDKSE